MQERIRHPKISEAFDLPATQFVFSAMNEVSHIDKKARQEWYLARLNTYAQKWGMSPEDASGRVVRTLEVLLAEYRERRLKNIPLAVYEILALSPIPALARGVYRRVMRGQVLWKGETVVARVKDAARRHSPSVAVAHNSTLISRVRGIRKLHKRSKRAMENKQ